VVEAALEGEKGATLEAVTMATEIVIIIEMIVMKEVIEITITTGTLITIKIK
jgi:hypothetical protein